MGDTVYLVPTIGGTPGANETIDSTLQVTINGTGFTLLTPTTINPGDTIKVENNSIGTATLTVNSQKDPTVSAQETLTKNPPAVNSAAFVPPAATQFAVGDQVQVSIDLQALQVSPATAGDKQYVLDHLLFATSDPAVATITPQGLVTFTGAGVVQINAEYDGGTVASLELTGNMPLNIEAGTIDTLLSGGDWKTITFTSNDTPYTDYANLAYSNYDESVLEFSADKSQVRAKADSPSGTYSFIVTYPEWNGVPTTLSASAIVEKSTGIEEVEKPDFKLYPNPVQDRLVIEGVEVKQGVIYNLQGKQLLRFNENEVSVIELPAGMYVVKLLTDKGGMFTAKIVKK
jgi:hypothetical protein